MTAIAAVPDENPRANPLIMAAILVVVGVFATTLGQTSVLGRIPITNLLKNELHISREAAAGFFFLTGLPWYFKPIAGILTDAFPILGSRRKTYILVSTGLAVLSWVALYFTPHTYNSLLWVCIVINTFMVGASTVVGAFMVETAQAASGSGRLTALRQFVQQVCVIINGPTAGYLGSVAFGFTAAACGGVLFLLIPATILLLRERKVTINSAELLANAGLQLGKIASARTMWAAAGLMALFYIAPGLSTAVFYRQQNELHLATQGQGNLQFIYGSCGVLAALFYAWACRRLNLRTLLLICMSAGTIGNLGFLFYTSVENARLIHALDGFGYTLAELALMDLAVRATPAGSEGLGFSLMVSVRNLALFGTDWLGSFLLDRYHWPFNWLVFANAATTLMAVPLVLFLPAILVRHKDAELYEEAAAPPSAIQQD